MIGGGGEPPEGLEELGLSDKDTVKGGSQPKGVGDVFKGDCIGGTSLQVKDVDDENLYGPINEGGSAQVS